MINIMQELEHCMSTSWFMAGDVCERYGPRYMEFPLVPLILSILIFQSQCLLHKALRVLGSFFVHVQMRCR